MKARLLFLLFSISLLTILSLAISVVSNAQTGNALSFDGDDRVIVPNSPSLNPTQITVEAWIKPTKQTDPSDWGTSQFLITKGSDDSLGTYYLAQGYDRKFRFSIGPQWQGPATSLSGPSAELQLGRWYHVAGTYDGNIMRLYIDGVLEDTKVVGPLQIGNSSPLFFSYNDYPGWNYFFNGQMKDIRIWNYARTENEIQQNTSGPLSGTESGLVGYWRLDDGSGQTAHDASGNGNDGQLGSTNGVDADDPTWITSSCAKPSLTLSTSAPSWATYADYQARELSVTLTITKNSPETAYDVAITGSTNTNGVELLTATPITIKGVFDGNSENTTVRYHVPVGVVSFKTSITASASDACGTNYSYP